MIYLFNILLIN